MIKYRRVDKLIKHDWGRAVDDKEKVVGVILHIYTNQPTNRLSVNCEDFERFYRDPTPFKKHVLYQICVLGQPRKERLHTLERAKELFDNGYSMGEYKLIDWYDVDGGMPVELPIETTEQPSMFHKLNGI